uniref:Uncharacterized protein n=1 Tax=Arundo donax TaxID=35708 RepID=A0A0A8YZ19_ARUDO
MMNYAVLCIWHAFGSWCPKTLLL